MNSLFVIFASGFSIGLLGSFHCVGMCGPLALSLPINDFNPARKIFAILTYNLGRTFTYTCLGAAFGIIGQSFSFFKLQQYLSIGAGVFILATLLISKLDTFKAPTLAGYSSKVKSLLGNLLRADKNLSSFLSIGIINGLLPCGLVYIGIAAGVATGTIVKSALLMFAFGLGTLPIMAFTMILGKYLSMQFRSRLNKITPFVIAIIAVLLIVRGMNLGIPYLSPTHNAHHVNCCQED